MAGRDQPSINHQAVVVEGDSDSVGMVKWQHLGGAPGLVWGGVCVSKTIIPEAQEHFLTPSARRDTHLFGGLGLNGDWPCRFRFPGVAVSKPGVCGLTDVSPTGEVPAPLNFSP